MVCNSLSLLLYVTATKNYPDAIFEERSPMLRRVEDV